MQSRGLLAVRLLTSLHVPQVVQAFRNATALSVSVIRDGIESQIPLPVARLFQLDHDEVAPRALSLIGTLAHIGERFEMLLEERVTSLEQLTNRLDSWKTIRKDTRMQIDLEIGEPSINTLCHLKLCGPDVFLHTLRLIEGGNGYTVDDETMAWVRSELKKASPGSA
jgi:hypothetical protein